MLMLPVLFGCADPSAESSNKEELGDEKQVQATEVALMGFDVAEGVKYALNERSIGDVSIGDDVSKLVEVYGDDQVRQLSGPYATVTYGVFLAGADIPSFEVIPACDANSCEIGEVLVADPAFHTSKNIHVGSTLSDIYESYSGLNIADENGRVVLHCAELSHISFILDRTAFGAGVSLDEMAGNTKIVGIYLY